MIINTDVPLGDGAMINLPTLRWLLLIAIHITADKSLPEEAGT